MAIDERSLPPYDPAEVLALPFPRRLRMNCRTWASQIQPTPFSLMAMYWAKYIFLFIGGWAFWVSFSSSYTGFTDPASWAFSHDAFRKAIAWAIFYELMGFGCGSGPMNARYWPPIGGFLHYLRPGTIKLPFFPDAPVIGGSSRTWLDVALYGANQLFLLRVLVAPEVTADLLLPTCILLPVLGVLDTTLFLAARSEHYFLVFASLFVCFDDGVWIAAAKLVWCFIWFWAASSKVNHHFPSVIMVMMNNGPFFPKWLKSYLFAGYPDDLRPSRFATFMAHFGTLSEYMLPVCLILATELGAHPLALAAACLFVTSFHGWIGINNPSGMPVDWNILMIYGAWWLWFAHPTPPVQAIFLANPAWAAVMLFCLFVVPLYGNLVPKHVSFLLAMRYYAGNWAYNVWLFRGDSEKKLAKIKKASGTFREQLASILKDEKMLAAAMSMLPVSRFMHLQGRPLLEAIPRAVDHVDNYTFMDGEVLGGVVLGWNFGDGHLNGKRLLDAVQERCGFEPGELRVVSVESEPLFGHTMEWKVWDAATGLVDEDTTDMRPMRALQPWPEGAHAEAFERGNPSRAASA